MFAAFQIDVPHSPWSPWRIVGIQPRHRWLACLPLSCSCIAVNARGWVCGSEHPAPSAPCPRFSRPWTSARAPPADWRRHTPWSRPAEENVFGKSRRTSSYCKTNNKVINKLTFVLLCTWAQSLLPWCTGSWHCFHPQAWNQFSSARMPGCTSSVPPCSLVSCVLQKTTCFKTICSCYKDGHVSKTVTNCHNPTDLSMPVSSFTSMCSITSFFLCKHSCSFEEELQSVNIKKNRANFYLKIIKYLWMNKHNVWYCWTLIITDLIRGISWSLNCLSNKWKIEFACWTTSRKYRLAFLASEEGIAVE